MASSLAVRLLQKNCGRTVLGVSNQGRNVFFQRIPVQALTSFSAFQKCNKNLALNIQKSPPYLCSIRTTSTDKAKDNDHTMLWTAEKVLAVVMLGAAFPGAVLFNSLPTEFFLALCLTVHVHWGLEAVVLDYVQPSIFGKVIPKVAQASVYVMSAVTLGGLCYFIYTDVGLVNAVKLMWKL